MSEFFAKKWKYRIIMMDYLKQPVFAIGNINEDINLSLPPTSGEEYIKRVV